MYYHNLNDLDAAIENFTKAVELDPNDFLALQARGFCWFQKGNMEEAVTDLKKAKTIDSYEPHPNEDVTIKEAESKIMRN